MSQSPSSHARGLVVLQGNRMEDLRDLALMWLARDPLHPLDRTVFLVQSNGIAQWLKTSIAERQGASGRGICLGTDVMLPARFQWQAYRSVIEAAEGAETVPATSPYDKTRLRWRLLALLPELLADPLYAPLARYLRADDELRKHYQLAERLADLFDQYQVYRADWLNAWEAGRDELILAGGQAEPVPAEQRWQPDLWRRIGVSLGDELASSHRAGVHRRFQVAAGQLDSRPPGLPPRVVVFGISSLPRQMLEVLAGVAGLSEVILCLLNPCQHYWGEIIETREVLRRYHRQQRRKNMPSDLHLNPELLHLHAHPLLAAWGKQGRDYVQLLAEHDATDLDVMAALQQPVDLFQTPDTGTLLGQLQADILELRPLAESTELWPPLEPSQDHSIRFHVCHSPQRELEVLHDQLLAAFAADPDLQPRDVMVMVPDINDYAPYIDAVFGQFAPGESRYLPYHIADQQQRHRQPMLVALDTLLSLPRLRFRASEILDLLEIAPLRERFGLAAGDLPTLQRWIHGANVRWGLHAAQRSELGLPMHDDLHTWRFGLERMLMGYAVGESAGEGEDWQGVVPYDEVAGLDAALVGPLYRLILTLDQLRAELQQPRPAAEWGVTLSRLLDATLQPTHPAEEGLLGLIRGALEGWQEEIEEAGLEAPLPLAVVRESWLARIDEPRLSQSFLMGRITFATLMPMRAIPFDHIHLLGMNDGTYPRRADSPDFDLMAVRGHYRAGDRSRREDDRYLFLEALLSARKRLAISWCGRSVKDNSEQPPSVLVGQLRDHLARGWQLAGHADDVLAALTTEHPLQPFGAAYFQAETGLFTYADEWQGGGSTAPRRAIPEPLLPPWRPEGAVSLAQLESFLRDPVAALFRDRLSTHMREFDALGEDDEPFAFDGLGKWQQRDALLQPLGQQLAQAPELDLAPLFSRRVEQRQRAGDYPPHPVGPTVREALLEPLPVTLEAYRKLLTDYPHRLAVNPRVQHDVVGKESEPDLRLADSLDGLHQGRTDAGVTRVARIVLLTSAIHQGKDWRWSQLLRHWPAHLALQTLHPNSSSHLVSPSGSLELRGMPEGQARAWLTSLLQAWLQGMHSPTPSHPDIAFPALAQYPPGEALQPWPPADCYRDSALQQTWEKAWEKLQSRSPLLLRQFPSLDELLKTPGFGRASLDLYAGVQDWVSGDQEVAA